MHFNLNHDRIIFVHIKVINLYSSMSMSVHWLREVVNQILQYIGSRKKCFNQILWSNCERFVAQVGTVYVVMQCTSVPLDFPLIGHVLNNTEKIVYTNKINRNRLQIPVLCFVACSGTWTFQADADEGDDKRTILCSDLSVNNPYYYTLCPAPSGTLLAWEVIHCRGQFCPDLGTVLLSPEFLLSSKWVCYFSG